MVTFTINIPPMLAYIAAPWIRHGILIVSSYISPRKDEKLHDSSPIFLGDDILGWTWHRGSKRRYAKLHQKGPGKSGESGDLTTKNGCLMVI